MPLTTPASHWCSQPTAISYTEPKSKNGLRSDFRGVSTARRDNRGGRFNGSRQRTDND